jgi:hypothetical protein
MPQTIEKSFAGGLVEVAAVFVAYWLGLAVFAGNFGVQLNDRMMAMVSFIPDTMTALARRLVGFAGHKAAHGCAVC